MAPEKTVWATNIIVFLGILIDTISQTISIPIKKCEKALNQLNYVINARTVTVLELQQLTGLLNFISRAVVPGTAFTRRMYVKYANIGRKLK